MSDKLNPITREEMYLAAAAGQEIEVPKPITRKEMFLAKMAGLDVVTLVPITREEMYLAAGQDTVILEPVTREEMYLAAAAGQEVKVPKPITRKEMFLEKLAAAANTVEFHVIEDDKLIIMGAFSVVETPDGLYLDCEPDVEWEYPVQTGNVLRITQVYAATQKGNVLEVE